MNSGNGYYVGGGYACCNIYCTNGVKYIVCVSKDDAFGGYASRLQSGNSVSNENVYIDIKSSVTEDLSNIQSPESKVINYRKISNSLITIENELKLEYENFVLIITQGTYSIIDNKLQAVCNLK